MKIRVDQIQYDTICFTSPTLDLVYMYEMLQMPLSSNKRIHHILPISISIAGFQVSYFFLFSEKFLFFLFFPIFNQNSYFFLFFSSFFPTFILFFSQKLKEASEIRRISCSGKSHSCEIASLWSFSPK